MKKIKNVFLSLFVFSSVAFGAAGDRYIENPTSNKDIVIQVNKGGVKTEVLKAVGSTGAVLLKGDNSGTVAASGNIGEIVTATLVGINQSSPVSTTFYDDAGTLTLTAGNWLIFSNANLYMHSGGSAAGGGVVPIIYNSIRTGSTALKTQLATSAQVTGIPIISAPLLVIPVSISATTIYKQSIKWEPNTGSPTLTQIGTTAGGSSLFAIRVN